MLAIFYLTFGPNISTAIVSMNGWGGVEVCWGGGESGWEVCAGRVRGCVGRALGVRGACVGRVWEAISVGIARSALLSGYLGKSGHLPR